MKYALIGFVAAIVLLWVALYPFHRSTVVREGRLKWDQGLSISYRISSEGGALGNLHYEVYAENDGRKDKIFQGIDGQQFEIRKAASDLIRIRFCNGMVEHASAVRVDGRPPVTVQPDLYCPAV